MRITLQAAIAPAIQTGRPVGNREVAVTTTLHTRKNSARKDGNMRSSLTQILPAFQLSGTVKETELDGGASHLADAP